MTQDNLGHPCSPQCILGYDTISHEPESNIDTEVVEGMLKWSLETEIKEN